jgi:hypothetical protein
MVAPTPPQAIRRNKTPMATKTNRNLLMTPPHCLSWQCQLAVKQFRTQAALLSSFIGPMIFSGHFQDNAK